MIGQYQQVVVLQVFIVFDLVGYYFQCMYQVQVVGKGDLDYVVGVVVVDYWVVYQQQYWYYQYVQQQVVYVECGKVQVGVEYLLGVIEVVQCFSYGVFSVSVGFGLYVLVLVCWIVGSGVGLVCVVVCLGWWQWFLVLFFIVGIGLVGLVLVLLNVNIR